MRGPGGKEVSMKVVGRMTAITCACGATIICPTRTRTCVKERIVYVYADAEEEEEEKRKNGDATAAAEEEEEDKSNSKSETLDSKSRTRVVETERLCVVCMNNPPEAVYVPCGHLVACMDCIPKMNQWICLICRANIQQVVKVYTV